MKTKQKAAKSHHFTRDLDFRSHPRGELAKEVLAMIADGVIIPAVFLTPIIPKVFRPLLNEVSKRCREKRSERLTKSLSYLYRKRFISVVEKEGQQILTLSEDGKKRILHFDLDKIVIKRPMKWDGYWRIVLFDIPERKKQAREALRSKLKQLGFHQLQKSCFIHPFDCKSEIDYISELFEVAPYVNFIVAKEIEGTSQLQKIFHLP
jgi:CRISPR-associated endonuclease Cas2